MDMRWDRVKRKDHYSKLSQGLAKMATVFLQKYHAEYQAADLQSSIQLLETALFYTTVDSD